MSIIKNFLLHIGQRQRLVPGQRRILWTGSANLVFDLIEFRLQFVEFVFEIRRLLLLIAGQRNAGELFGNLLLPIEIVLLLLQQVSRHTFSDLRVNFAQHVEQRTRATCFRDAERFRRVIEGLA